MIEIQREKSKTLSLITDSAVTNVTISLKHSWGEAILTDETATTVSSTEHTYTLTSDDTVSCGEVKVIWDYLLGSTPKTKVDYFKVYVPYTSSSELYDDFPEVESFDEQFTVAERRIRNVIDVYCGQPFEFHHAKTLVLDGTNNNALHLPMRIDSLTSVLKNGLDDITSYVEVHPESNFYLRKKILLNPDRSERFDRFWADYYDTTRFFRTKRTYNILGDWGWPFVPSNITEASKILIADYFNQDSDYRRHRINFQGTGPIQTKIDDDYLGSTGNIDADVLLMDYQRWVMNYI